MDQLKRWYRKSQVAARYGVCGRTVDRAIEAGKLPQPKFPLGNNSPYWDVDELDAHDRNLAARIPEQSKPEAVEAPSKRRGRPRKSETLSESSAHTTA